MAAELTLDLEGWNEFKAQHLDSGTRAPARVEDQVIQWIAGLMQLPARAGGTLLGSGLIANILGLAVARHAGCGFDVRKCGIYGGDAPVGRVWNERNARLGSEGPGAVGASDPSRGRDIANARFPHGHDATAPPGGPGSSRGLQPLCVIGTVGAAGNGREEEDIWLHVDGAFGALAQWSERLRDRVAGIERADSIAFDLRKWSYQPFAIACLLIRNGEIHRNACAGGLPFVDSGEEPGRELRAFEAWMSLKTHGAGLITAVMEQNVDRASHLASLVGAHAELELLAPTELNIVCFRYVPRGCANQPLLNALNEELLIRLQEHGNKGLSGSVLEGRFCLRCTFASRRARPEDTSQLAVDVARVGAQLAKDRLP